MPACTALIVGVRGLGRAIARQFAQRGWRVLCAARTPATVEAAVAEVNAAGGHGQAAVCDLQDPASLRKVVESVDRIDLVVASQTSGSRFGPRPLLEIDEGELEQVWRAYVGGTWNLLRAVGPVLTAQRSGTFLQMGTSSGIRTRDGWAPLGTAQHGLRALVQIAAKEWRPQGVHVAYVPIDGGIVRGSSSASGEAPRALPPEEIARACAYLVDQPPAAWTHELVLRPCGTDWSAPT